jgi:hypothetical protein
MQVTQLYKFLLVLFLSHTAMAQLPFAYGIKRKAYRVESQTSLLQSASSFDASGKQVAFQEGEAFAMVNTSLGMYYGWTNEVELGASLRYRMVGINSLETSSNSIISNRASGLESIQSLVRYKFKPIKNFYYSAQFAFRYALYKNKEYDSTKPLDFMVLGDGGSEIEVGLNTSYLFSESLHSLSAKLFFRNPGTTLSEEILTQVQGNLQYSKLGIYAGLEYLLSLKKDEFKDNPTQKPSIGEAQTEMFNSVNRSWMAPYVGVSYKIGDSWMFALDYKKAISGISVDAFQAISFSLFYSVDKKVEIKEAHEKFKNYSKEAYILKISDKKKYFLIDQGLSSGIKQGMYFDIYDFDYKGQNTLIARAVVVEVKASKSGLQVLKYYSKTEIKEGMAARGEPLN